MSRGTVKWFNDQKGYGFIEPEGGGEDVFVHYTGILGDGFKTLSQGQLVEYEIAATEKGLRAVNLQKCSV